MKIRLSIVLLLLVAVLGACGEDNKVGEGVDLNIKDQVNSERLGAATTTTTTAAPTETSAPQSAAVGRATTTTAAAAAPVASTTTAAPAPAPTTTTKAAPVLAIAINGDAGGQSQFDPSQARVYVGTTVKWTNADSQPRSIEADDGTFASSTLAPGESFTYKTDRAGKFNYHDGTRPYAVGTLEVSGR